VDDRRSFVAFKQDKQYSDTVAEMVRKKKEELNRYPRSEKQKAQDIDHESFIPHVKQSDYAPQERDWNANLEPAVLVPKTFQAKVHSDRIDQQGSILERMQQALEQHTVA
jgi:hypothetical protein